MAYNVGIIGGNDIDFFQNYCQLSLDFVYKNKDIWSDSYIRKLDQFDEIILYELNSPKSKNELFNSLLLHFETELSSEEKEKFKIMLDERIENLTVLKVIIISIN